jgi:hypothetical protein
MKSHHAYVINILPIWAGATKSGSRICALYEKGPREPFIRRICETSWRFTYHPSSHRAWRTPHHAEQIGDNPEPAEGETERCIPGGVLKSNELGIGCQNGPAGCESEPISTLACGLQSDVLNIFQRRGNSVLRNPHMGLDCSPVSSNPAMGQANACFFPQLRHLTVRV